MPTNEELQDYIYTYKSNLLKDKDEEKGKAFERGNEVDSRLSSQLLLIASALITVIGGFVAADNKIVNAGVKVLLTSTVVFLLLSVLLGLIEYTTTANFFEKWGYHLHKQGRVILDDESKTYEELTALRNRLQRENEQMPTQAPKLPRILQTSTFLIGVIFLMILVLVKIYS